MAKGTKAIKPSMVANVRHVLIPGNKYGSPDVELGRFPGQSYFTGAKPDSSIMNVDKQYVEWELANCLQESWDERNRFSYNDYISLSLDQQIQLQHLHSILDDARGYMNHAHGMRMLDESIAQADALASGVRYDKRSLQDEPSFIDFYNTKAAVNEPGSTSQKEQLLYISRVLTHYDTYFSKEAGPLEQKVLFLFLCEVRQCERGSDPLRNVRPPSRLLHEIAFSQEEARIVDSHHKADGGDSLDIHMLTPIPPSVCHAESTIGERSLESPLSAMSTLSRVSQITEEKLPNLTLQENVTLQTLQNMSTLGNDPALTVLYVCLFELYNYSESDGVSQDNKGKSRALLKEQLHHIKFVLADSSPDIIQTTQEKLLESVNRPKYRCLTKSTGWKLKLANALLLFPVIGWATAAINKAVTGSFCFRSTGGKKRKALERVVAASSTVFSHVSTVPVDAVSQGLNLASETK